MKNFGRYEVQKILGRGGMGTVYLAQDPVIGRQVAVKVIQTETGLADSEQIERMERFEREFRSAGSLSHPNVVTVFDVGIEADHAFIAMEYLPGPGLDSLMSSGEPLSLHRIADLAVEIAAALDYAHGLGIVHRDVKPANILLTPEGRPKITDFGVAKLASTTLTVTGTALGTPRYMAPEMLSGQPVTGASDQFSLGIILYEMLTGQLPFHGDTPTALMYQLVYEEPPSPDSLNPTLNDRVCRALGRALEKEAGKRFESCNAFALEVRAAVAEAPPDATVVVRRDDVARKVPEKTATSDIGTIDLPLESLPPARRHESKFQWLIPAIATALVLVAGTVWFFNREISGSVVPDTAEATEPSGDTSGDRLTRSLSVESESAGAAIWVNGIDRGKQTPAMIELAGTVGDSFLLQLKSNGVIIAEQTMLLGEDLPPRWAPTLAPQNELQKEAFEITTQPAGARIFLGGEALSEPSPARIELEASVTYELRVELEGYKSAGLTFALADLSDEQRSTRRLYFPLTPKVAPALLVVETSYPAEVEVDGRKYSLSSSREIALSPGTHELVLSATDVYYRESRTVTLASKEKLELRLPRAVTVTVAATPSNCRVQIDGRDAGYVPITVRLSVGRHQFDFEWAGLGKTLSKTERINVNTKQIIHAAPTG